MLSCRARLQTLQDLLRQLLGGGCIQVAVRLRDAPLQPVCVHLLRIHNRCLSNPRAPRICLMIMKPAPKLASISNASACSSPRGGGAGGRAAVKRVRLWQEQHSWKPRGVPGDAGHRREPLRRRPHRRLCGPPAQPRQPPHPRRPPLPPAKYLVPYQHCKHWHISSHDRVHASGSRLQ